MGFLVCYGDDSKGQGKSKQHQFVQGSGNGTIDLSIALPGSK